MFPCKVPYTLKRENIAYYYLKEIKKLTYIFIESIITNCPKHLTDSDVGALMRIFDNITKPNVCAFKKAM